MNFSELFLDRVRAVEETGEALFNVVRAMEAIVPLILRDASHGGAQREERNRRRETGEHVDANTSDLESTSADEEEEERGRVHGSDSDPEELARRAAVLERLGTHTPPTSAAEDHPPLNPLAQSRAAPNTEEDSNTSSFVSPTSLPSGHPFGSAAITSLTASERGEEDGGDGHVLSPEIVAAARQRAERALQLRIYDHDPRQWLLLFICTVTKFFEENMERYLEQLHALLNFMALRRRRVLLLSERLRQRMQEEAAEQRRQKQQQNASCAVAPSAQPSCDAAAVAGQETRESDAADDSDDDFFELPKEELQRTFVQLPDNVLRIKAVVTNSFFSCYAGIVMQPRIPEDLIHRVCTEAMRICNALLLWPRDPVDITSQWIDDRKCQLHYFCKAWIYKGEGRLAPVMRPRPPPQPSPHLTAAERRRRRQQRQRRRELRRSRQPDQHPESVERRLHAAQQRDSEGSQDGDHQQRRRDGHRRTGLHDNPTFSSSNSSVGGGVNGHLDSEDEEDTMALARARMVEARAQARGQASPGESEEESHHSSGNEEEDGEDDAWAEEEEEMEESEDIDWDETDDDESETEEEEEEEGPEGTASDAAPAEPIHPKTSFDDAMTLVLEYVNSPTPLQTRLAQLVVETVPNTRLTALEPCIEQPERRAFSEGYIRLTPFMTEGEQQLLTKWMQLPLTELKEAYHPQKEKAFIKTWASPTYDPRGGELTVLINPTNAFRMQLSNPTTFSVAGVQCDMCCMTERRVSYQAVLDSGVRSEVVLQYEGCVGYDVCVACSFNYYKTCEVRLLRALHPSVEARRPFAFGRCSQTAIHSIEVKQMESVMVDRRSPRGAASGAEVADREVYAVVEVVMGVSPFGVLPVAWVLPPLKLDSLGAACPLSGKEQETYVELTQAEHDALPVPSRDWQEHCTVTNVSKLMLEEGSTSSVGGTAAKTAAEAAPAHQTMEELIDEADVCPICLQLLHSPLPVLRTLCGHWFHVECIGSHYHYKPAVVHGEVNEDNGCPVCRCSDYMPSLTNVEETLRTNVYKLELRVPATALRRGLAEAQRTFAVAVGTILTDDGVFRNATNLASCEAFFDLVPEYLYASSTTAPHTESVTGCS